MGWVLIVMSVNGMSSAATMTSLGMCRQQFQLAYLGQEIKEAYCVNTSGDRVNLFPVRE
jgi:hypothetical protein